MLREYLEDRKELLNDTVRYNKEKYDHNQIAIAESKNQIKELDEKVDEATKIFSVKAREDNGFKNQEISDLEKRIAAYTIENNEYELNIKKAKDELSIVETCLQEIKENIKVDILSDNNIQTANVSRETSESIDANSEPSGVQLNIEDILNDKYNNLENQELIRKLEFCKSIAEIDGKRVAIELNNIINMISE